jgi:hypothetical protein
MENLMKNKKILFVVLSLILLLSLSACGSDVFAELEQGQTAQPAEQSAEEPPAADAEPTAVDPVAIFTSAAETVAAQITQTAAAFSPTPEPPTAIPPTATLIQLDAASPTPNPALPTATLGAGVVPTVTIIPTATTVTIVNTPEGPICDSMAYGSPLDINYADNTVVPAGTTFEKIWRITNTGVCTWDDGYILVYIGDGENTRGDQNPMGVASVPFKIKNNVQPGQNVDVGAVMTAPLDNGTYESCFVMQNDRGVFFGGAVCVKIKVTDGK